MTSLKHRKQNICLNNMNDHNTINVSAINVHVGVPHGSILGPVLLLLYINVIKDVLIQLTTTFLLLSECTLTTSSELYAFWNKIMIHFCYLYVNNIAQSIGFGDSQQLFAEKSQKMWCVWGTKKDASIRRSIAKIWIFMSSLEYQLFFYFTPYRVF